MWSEAELLVRRNLSDTEFIDAVIKDITTYFLKYGVLPFIIG